MGDDGKARHVNNQQNKAHYKNSGPRIVLYVRVVKLRFFNKYY
jgi:hypothetical protein